MKVVLCKRCLGFEKACRNICRIPATWQPDLQMATSLARSTMTPSMCAPLSLHSLAYMILLVWYSPQNARK